MQSERNSFKGKVRLTSAGGVVLRSSPGQASEVVICGRSSENLWALPKGTPHSGEAEVETAKREVEEETGLNVRTGPFIAEIRYSFVRPADGARCDKRVRFYLMQAVGGDTANHDGEFDQVLWLSAEEALSRLTYQNEARIVKKALALAAAEGRAG